MMDTSEQINELAQAVTNLQATLRTLKETAEGYNRRYSYVPLHEILDYLREPLFDNGLALVQFPSTPPEHCPHCVALTTRLMHTSGQWSEETMVMPIPETPASSAAQNYGSGLTYARRYAITAILGLVSDEDVDASTNGKQPAQARQRQVTTKPVQPPPPTNGDEAKFAGRLADARADLESKITNGSIILGIVADVLVMTALYDDRKHVSNALNGPDFKDLRDAGLKVDLRCKVSKTGALSIFDVAIARKEAA